MGLSGLQDVEKLLEDLPERDQKVIRLRFGLDEGEHTLEEVGRKLGVTRERVRQLEARSLEWLRRSPEMQALGEDILGDAFVVDEDQRGPRRVPTLQERMGTPGKVTF